VEAESFRRSRRLIPQYLRTYEYEYSYWKYVILSGVLLKLAATKSDSIIIPDGRSGELKSLSCFGIPLARILNMVRCILAATLGNNVTVAWDGDYRSAPNFTPNLLNQI
jgi:hypothetical protein